MMKVTVVHKCPEDVPITVADVETPFAVVEEVLNHAYLVGQTTLWVVGHAMKSLKTVRLTVILILT